eukprot:TRINITY_DN11237_c1_g1_i1.p1 TRINITY_DN11237_c1_g1~~TRINITY_DN11237_c1_g1_i1.p1  ORF type:complete len:394 (+),score=89.05 TRINITY_DN11237_c1_g1_i1:52-1233(+)
MASGKFKDVLVVGAKRTAFGTFGGSLKTVTATDLGVIASKAAISQSALAADKIDQVVFGSVSQTSVDALYLSRHIGLKSGLRVDAPALTVNRLCGSGFEAVVQGAKLIETTEANTVLTGGTENMSQAPHCIYGARDGLALGKGKLVDSLWDGLTDTYIGMPMGMTAENLAEQYNITQEEVDNFSVRSQTLHGEAQKNGVFNDEICVSEVKKGRKVIEFAADEHGRPSTKVEDFAKLPKIFKKDGVIHPGAASGICDGAAAIVLSNEANATAPLARIIGFGVAGCDPKIMGIGPVPSIRLALERCELSMKDIGLFEVNEAFAPQALAVQKELGIDTDKFNINGGAIAVGHPLGASGARIVTHLVYSMKQRGVKYAVGSACIGGGQGIAVILEAI